MLTFNADLLWMASTSELQSIGKSLIVSQICRSPLTQRIFFSYNLSENLPLFITSPLPNSINFADCLNDDFSCQLDCTCGPESKNMEQHKATYAIRCSLRNFEAYATDIGVLKFYLVSEQGQVFGRANVDKLPSLEHPVINTWFPVVMDTGQQIARVLLAFKLEEIDKQVINPQLTNSWNVQDTVAALLIKSHKLQKSMNKILNEKTTVCQKNVRPVNGQHQMALCRSNLDRKPVDYVCDIHSVMDEVNRLKMSHYSMLSPEAADVLVCTANIAQDLVPDQGVELRAKSDKELKKKANENVKNLNESIKSKSPSSLKVDLPTSEPKIINVNYAKNCCVFNKCGPLMHCLLSIPKGDGLLHPVFTKYSHSDCKGRNLLYLVVRMLWQKDIFRSDVTSNGKFAFHQVTSFHISHQLLNRLHNNFISIEVWEKITSETDRILGMCKLPMHLFYLACRDVIVGDTFSANSTQAVVAVDDRLPVENIFCGNTLGYLQVLFAMGTEQQIKQFEESTICSPHTNIRETETIEHVYEITTHVLRLYQPPLSHFWGESDCFILYLFPVEDLHAQRSNCHLYLTKYVVGPRLCQESIQFKTTIKHTFLSHASSLQHYFNKAFPLQKLPLQVWCRYYNPKEEDILIAEANIPLSSLVNLISGNGNMKMFKLNLEEINPSNKNETVGYVEIQINYNTFTKATGMKEYERLEELKVHPSSHHSLGATGALMVDNLRNKLTRLENIQSLMEDMLKSMSLEKEHDESPEVISSVCHQMNELIVDSFGKECTNLFESLESKNQSADITVASNLQQLNRDSTQIRDNSSLSVPDTGVHPVHEDGISSVSLVNECQHSAHNIRPTRRKSRVAAAIFSSESTD